MAIFLNLKLTITTTVVTMTSPHTSRFADRGIQPTLHGALTIMSPTGLPHGFLNAEEVTAFRTALASSLLICRRTHLKTITVFGAGKQAYWHIRIALLLRGWSIKTINIINRTMSDRTRQLMKGFINFDPDVKAREGWTNAKFSMMTPSYGEYDRLIKEQLRAADAIITTVPSTEPLFDHTILTSTEGRRKGRLTIAVGSYKPNMIEIPVEILHQAVRSQADHRHFHKHAIEGGVVVVDTLTGCLREAGEIIQAGLSPMQLVEVGELVMLEGQNADPGTPDDSSDIDIEKLKLSLRESSQSGESSMKSIMREDSGSSKTPSRKGSFSRLSRKSSRSEKSSSADSKPESKEDAMTRWLSQGNVIYKSVGMGLMDLVVGGEIVRLARDTGLGTTIRDF